MVGILHCGSGNIGSVVNAFNYLGADTMLVQKAEHFEQCSRLVLPGVGSFRDAVLQLDGKGLLPDLQTFAMVSKKPVLGICLGMQIMTEIGFEGGETQGLGWFKGTVERIQKTSKNERVPHVGWNELSIHQKHPLLERVPDQADFYFVHSYSVLLQESSCLVASCAYAQGITAIVAKENVFAMQFHPEKSQDHGIRILENFLAWQPSPC
jgi:glutamine amidotransferase